MPNPYDPYDRGTVLDPSVGTLVRVKGERVLISYWEKEAKPGRVGTDASGTKFVVLRDLGRDVEDSVAIISTPAPDEWVQDDLSGLQEMGRRHGLCAAAPILADDGPAFAVLLLGPEAPRPRILGQLESAARRL